MWRNYLTVGLRALAKNRTYSIINIAGLSIGMAACLMILLFVRYELSYDQWLPDAANTYQVQSWYHSKETGEQINLQMTSYIAGERLTKDFPQILNKVYMTQAGPTIIKDGQPTVSEDYYYTDGNLLDVLPLPMVVGGRDALKGMNSLVMSQSEARHQFGTEQALGKVLTVISKGVRRDYRVTGVMRDLPKNSHLKIAAIFHIDLARVVEPGFLTSWGSQAGWVYVRLQPGTDPATIVAQLPAWKKRNIPDEISDGIKSNDGDDQDWHLVRVADIHVGEAQNAAMTPGNDRGTIATFAVVALLILGMAVVNFINLSTSRASQRAREVALRKVLGARRGQLITQFLGESVLIATLAMVIALALVELLMPTFATFLDADLKVRYFGPDGIALPVVVLVLVVGILGGLYPAFFLSRFQPAAVLKANRSAAETPGSGRLRNALVVGQFAVSIGLIICTVVIYAQTVYARTVDPGYARGHILQVENLNRTQLADKGQVIVDAMKRIDGVAAVGRGSIGVATSNTSNTGYTVPGSTSNVGIGDYRVDGGFFDAMGLKLVAGRWFDEAREADDSTLPYPSDPVAEQAQVARGVNVVINELAARRLGFANPAAIVGKTFKASLIPNSNLTEPVTVIGVLHDARFRSIKKPLEPIGFHKTRNSHDVLIIRYRGDPRVVRAQVEQVWKRLAPEVPFEAQFSEDLVEKLYRAEDARAKTFAGFAVLSVIVGCLGLFGLAAFTAERRTKEIGIRKVLGARTRDIVRLLVWQFSRPVVIANIIAWPVAWWLMRDWLNGFDDRITLSPLPFLAAGLMALAIAVITVGGHAIRIARANPIHALRYE
ncbi:ABC transporter permease [Sphingosinicellaceae bacterium]|nr:ABC transporter permease [Sphingosinicellaceae bacterium]